MARTRDRLSHTVRPANHCTEPTPERESARADAPAPCKQASRPQDTRSHPRRERGGRKSRRKTPSAGWTLRTAMCCTCLSPRARPPPPPPAHVQRLSDPSASLCVPHFVLLSARDHRAHHAHHTHHAPTSSPSSPNIRTGRGRGGRKGAYAAGELHNPLAQVYGVPFMELLRDLPAPTHPDALRVSSSRDVLAHMRGKKFALVACVT